MESTTPLNSCLSVSIVVGYFVAILMEFWLNDCLCLKFDVIIKYGHEYSVAALWICQIQVG